MSKLNLALGSAQFGMKYGITNLHGELSEDSVHEILDVAFQRGLTHVDTSLNYGNSMDRLKKYLKTKSNVSVRITSKFSLLGNLNQIYAELENFLRTCGLDSYASILIHDPWSEVRSEKHLKEFLEKIVKNGISQKIGCSAYSMSDYQKMNVIYPMEVIQCPVNPFQTHFLDGGDLNGKIIIHARSLFLQGLLLSDRIPEKLSRLQPFLNEYKNILKKHAMSPLEGLFQWASAQKRVSQWVIGVTDVSELNEILDARDQVSLYPKDIDFSPLDQYDDTLFNPMNWS
jgi:aryl-alcohol dehydrogenase-like predicted oxidoreductase